jgi:hypothetical protein
LRDGPRGSRRLCSVWIGWGRLKKRLAFTPKRKLKNWRNGNFGSIIRSSPSQKTNDADENHRPHRYPIGGPRDQSGILVSTHPDVMAAFAANDAFQKAEASGRHIRTKIVTLKDRLDVGQPVQPAHLQRKSQGPKDFCTVFLEYLSVRKNTIQHVFDVSNLCGSFWPKLKVRPSSRMQA